MVYKYSFVLKFAGQTEDGIISVTIPRADQTLDDTGVAARMNALIATNAISTKAGKPVSIKSANRIALASVKMIP
jgi:hypothetical protein